MPDGRDLRWILGQIRCVLECVDCLRHAQPLPRPLCYVPEEVHYKVNQGPSRVVPAGTLLTVWESPSYSQRNLKSLSRATIQLSKRSCIKATGEEYCNHPGLWVKLTKEQMKEFGLDCKMAEGWVLLWRKDEGEDRLVPVESSEKSSRQRQLFGVDSKALSRWEDVVDSAYIMRLGRGASVSSADEEAVQKLRFLPPSWSYGCDEDLARFLCERLRREDDGLDSVNQFVESISVSSFVGDHNVGCLTDGRDDTMWEASKEDSPLWIRLHMKEGTIIRKLLLTTDEQYVPKRVLVFGGKRNALEQLSDVTIDNAVSGDTCILRNMTTYLQTVEIRITELYGEGSYVWVRGIKIEALNNRGMRPTADMFEAPNLVRYPQLEAVDPDVLYWRAVVLQRFVKLLDNVLCHLIATSEDGIDTFTQLKHIKQLLLLSQRRLLLIAHFLKKSETAEPENMPELYMNRRLAAEHRDHPALDPTYKKTIFSQVYEGLKLSDKAHKPLDYRWPPTRNQWWICEFIAEGMHDCGGGFRDCMTDISEELCPSSADCPVPLPFFVRTSNQGHCIGESRDMYVPNPSCKDLAKYKWIGQLMGAALRGQDFLVLALPALVWKQLIGEEVSWSKDFPAVDSLLVKLLEMMEVMDKETFEFKFGGELMYTVVLSDQRMVELIPGGSNICVRYEDRLEFIRMVKKVRLEESKEQVEAIQSGLLKVVPQAVLDLLTWQEVEKKVCGDPEISVEALKKLTHIENPKINPTTVQYFWEALNNFTNEDRSRLLRFITGRSRLPTPVNIMVDHYVDTDSFPTSSTCSQILHLPNYSSAKVCEEKLRYAAYNCVAIDTDRLIWEE